VRLFHSAHETVITRTGSCPHAEGAVHVSPRSVFARHWDEAFEVVEATGVYVASLQQNNRGLAIRVAKCFFECTGIQRSSVIDAQPGNCLVTEAQQAQSAVDGCVSQSAKNTDLRRAAHAFSLNVPSVLPQQPCSCRREARGVSHLTAGDEGEGGRRRQ